MRCSDRLASADGARPHAHRRGAGRDRAAARAPRRPALVGASRQRAAPRSEPRRSRPRSRRAQHQRRRGRRPGGAIVREGGQLRFRPAAAAPPQRQSVGSCRSCPTSRSTPGRLAPRPHDVRTDRRDPARACRVPRRSRRRRHRLRGSQSPARGSAPGSRTRRAHLAQAALHLTPRATPSAKRSSGGRLRRRGSLGPRMRTQRARARRPDDDALLGPST